ncbi:MAG: PAS domain S-box protein [Fibrobacter sp.]|nr:PAS domain S-box protein [Fibrobacter sp.]
MSETNFEKSEQSSELAHIINCIADSIIIKNRKHQWVLLNDVFCKFIGYSREELLGKSDHDFFPKYQADLFQYNDNLVFETGQDNYCEEEITNKNGIVHTIFTKKSLFFNEKGEQFIIAVLSDITSQKEKEEQINKLNAELEQRVTQRTKALAEEKELLAVTLASIGDGVISVDIQGNVVIMNPIAEHLTGWQLKNAKSKPVEEVFVTVDEFSRKNAKNPICCILNSDPKIEEKNHTILLSRNGSEYIISTNTAPIRDSRGNLIGAVLVFRDITEKERIEEKLNNSQKLESIGVLAGGIAHDFNNILTGLFSNINLAKLNLDSNTKPASYLDDALNVLERAKGLTQQLLTFSKGGAPVKKVISIENLLKSNTPFFLSGTNIKYEFDFEKKLWNCEADENQIGQVIDNLILNARQAMGYEGMLILKAENIITKETCALPLPKNKKFVKISIRDFGPGISSDIINKIFDPFFTTKKEGSGLGLATAYSIVKKHEGFIDAVSSPGKGCTFTIFLPAIEKNIQIENSHHTNPITNKHILLMDDEEVIRIATSKLLTKMGHRVKTAINGTDTISIVKSSFQTDDPFDLLILDLTVPRDIGGFQTLQKLKNQFPDLKAVATSGYSEDPIIANPLKYGFVDAIRKPYAQKELEFILWKHLNH